MISEFSPIKCQHSYVSSQHMCHTCDHISDNKNYVIFNQLVIHLNHQHQFSHPKYRILGSFQKWILQDIYQFTDYVFCAPTPIISHISPSFNVV